MLILEHYRTLSNIYFQQPPKPAQPKPSTSKATTPSTQATPSTRTTKMLYQCKLCNHEPFQTKYGLARHISVKHEKRGTRCKICKRRMVHYHISNHLDSHGLTNRYHCKEKSKVIGGECDKQYKQLLGIK